MDYQTSLIFLTLLYGIFTVVCFTYTCFTHHKKGPILLNKYLAPTPETLAQIELQEEQITLRDYALVTKLFLLLGLLVLDNFCWALSLLMAQTQLGIVLYNLSLLLLFPLFIYNIYISHRYQV